MNLKILMMEKNYELEQLKEHLRKTQAEIQEKLKDCETARWS